MTTHPTAAAATGLPEPEFSLYGLSKHLDRTWELAAALGLCISTIDNVHQREAMRGLADMIDERISAAQHCASLHASALEKQEPQS